MKVALVHELLTMRGGAERVLRILARMFPDAPIYTLLYDEKKLGDWFPRERVHESNLRATFPYSLLLTPHSFHHHLYLKKFPNAIEAFDFSDFDLVISSSSAFAHGIITNGNPKHLCYVHSPARYLWDRTHDVLEQAGKGLLGIPRKTYLKRIFHTLRQWDAEVAPRPDMLIAASQEVQRRIQLYWDLPSDVIYPPIDDAWFQPRTPIKNQMQQHDYFLIVSTLATYKRIDLAIEACYRTGKYLKIVGEGPDRARLEKIASKTVEFYGYREGDELADLFTSAIATIVPGEEDFGLVPLESMATGTPVIAYGKGGLLETVIEGETGTFFHENTAESLSEILTKFDPKNYSTQNCINQAQKFSESEFVHKMNTTIKTLMKDVT
jgi:glycosyltransferase involved in cell wall biosynthesis